MSDFILDQYEKYLDSFRAWGQEFFERPLTYDQFEELSVEIEGLEIDVECGQLTPKQRHRMEEIELLMLTHKTYFADGPRVWINIDEPDTEA